MVALAITAGVVVSLVVSFNYHLGGAALSREDVIVAALGAHGRERPADETATFNLAHTRDRYYLSKKKIPN